MPYQRSPQAKQVDELRERLAATVAELQRTQKELHDANQIIAIARKAAPSHGNHDLTINHRKRVAECGTYSGYVRHVRNGEDRCDPCKTAHAIYLREYRARKAA